MVTDEMIKASWRVLLGQPLSDRIVRKAIEAALNARPAPTVPEDMAGLVERLRAMIYVTHDPRTGRWTRDPTTSSAADALTAQAARIAELERERNYWMAQTQSCDAERRRIRDERDLSDGHLHLERTRAEAAETRLAFLERQLSRRGVDAPT